MFVSLSLCPCLLVSSSQSLLFSARAHVHACVCVCMSVCMCVRASVCACTCPWACMRVSACVCVESLYAPMCHRVYVERRFSSVLVLTCILFERVFCKDCECWSNFWEVSHLFVELRSQKLSQECLMSHAY